MKINIVICKNEQEQEKIIKDLKIKYKDNKQCKFREISETFILPDKKWIVASEFISKQLHKRNPNSQLYRMEVIENALWKN